VDVCDKLSNETLLIKSKNLSQAMQLIQLTTVNNTIEVEVTEHNSLNYTQGVIYSNDLRDISETDILTELKSQNVVEVRKIIKKAQDTRIESGLITLKFASLGLPTHINIGYQRTAIRPFIPLPRRCFNCGRLGHSTTHCNANKLCLTQVTSTLNRMSNAKTLIVASTAKKTRTLNITTVFWTDNVQHTLNKKKFKPFELSKKPT